MDLSQFSEKENSKESSFKSSRTEKSASKGGGWFARNWILIVLLFILLGLGGGLVWTYRQYLESKREVEELKDPGKYAEKREEEAQQIVDQVAQLMVLPDENPTVATIIDVEALKEENEVFYKDAKNGDRLLIYSTRAILFRAEEDKIINVAPVQIVPREEVAGASDEEQTNDSDSSLNDNTSDETQPGGEESEE